MYEVEFYSSGESVPQEARHAIAEKLDRIADRIWQKDPNYWVNDQSLFSQDGGLILAHGEGQAVGFAVYRRVLLDNLIILYLGAINIIPEYQGKGIFPILCQPILACEWETAKGRALYVAARTRNPLIISETAKWCQNMVPGGEVPIDSDLFSLALRTADKLFPGVKLEVPSMILRKAYAAFSYLEPQHHKDRAVDSVVFENEDLAPDDAFFLFGMLRSERAARSVTSK